MTDQPPPIIRTRDVGVSFGGVSVLRNVNVDIRPAEIHGLVGENGAGKSTLGKVLGGYYAASAGSLEIGGAAVSVWTPHIALKNGIAMMHQELQLVPALTVAQNVFLGIEGQRFGVLRNNEATRLGELMQSTGFSLDPHAVTSHLPIADQQKIEVLRALARDAKVIIMDEPTSSLSKDEIINLHQTMVTLRENGRSVVYVSHFLDDILEVCDRITVLRDGDQISTLAASEITKPDLVSAILGGDKTETLFPKKVPPADPGAKPVLSVRGLKSANGTQSAAFDIGPGEIVGLVGLVGSGRTEIARAIIGADAAEGIVELDGQPYVERNPARSTQRGLVMVPEDRRGLGLVMTLPVRPNITLPHLRRFSTSGVLRTGEEKNEVARLIDYFQVRPNAIDGDISRYSGGNQQKVLLGKWLVSNPRVIILDEPSRGVDVGAREKIHQAIVEIAAQGTAIVLISSEIDEVLGLAHRAYLVDRGRTMEEIVPDNLTEKNVLAQLFALQNAG
ncbi:MAG: sugar ABC transporter ATP-binding protein [Hyphomicrobiaceae bacterium]|nr:sugar ABC transporter ATP-binding protein [Hyphomicrobiaceae bacterium]